jgi:hypothetical protein
MKLSPVRVTKGGEYGETYFVAFIDKLMCTRN